MNCSAIAICRSSSRMNRRTRTFVSTARILFSDVPPNSFVDLFERVKGRLPVTEDCSMNVLRRVAAGAPDDDFVALFFPFQHRARTDAELPPDLGRNGDLTLCGDFRLRHEVIVPR